MKLACLMQQQVIYILTHTIGLWEDGPIHQPIEHLTNLRSLPRMNLFRPADYIETREAWFLALAVKDLLF